jgi:tRNA pseudouridine32 synthase/23S rRNA pseudouridine746 synthase
MNKKSQGQLTSQAKQTVEELLINSYPQLKINWQELAEKGALQMQQSAEGWHRCRNLKTIILPRGKLKWTFEAKVLSLSPIPIPDPLFKSNAYSIWIKPAGVLSQGTDSGDHLSLLYQVEKKGITPFLVHRLDRETEGLMIVAHTQQGAAYFSRLFQDSKVDKTYLALVFDPENKIVIDESEKELKSIIDNKEACTRFICLRHWDKSVKLVKLFPLTGRKHQLRIHMAQIANGILGDPQYGRGNKNQDGLKLWSTELTFFDKWQNKICHHSFRPSYFTNTVIA